MSDTPRIWFRGANGLWSSREPTPDDVRRHTLYQQWAQKKMTLAEITKKMEKSHIAPEHYLP